ncbi:unnamed protein product [Parnassius mnemosyne]|uniref:THAP-type domain-containing protein n=1 Tax=Parnassius mnemosyne TaxID=213953 RepID=A0AAV1LAZ8_9NEOP
MSQQSCCVPSCTVTLGDDVPLHRFPNPSNPKEIERFRTWIIKIGGEIVGRDDLYIYDNRRICHNHFEEVFIYPTTRRLSKLAVPSLNLSGVYKQLPERLHHRLNEQQPLSLQMDFNIRSNIPSQDSK